VTAFRSAELWFGAGLVLLAIGVAIEGSRVTAGFGYDTVGPRAFPYLIATGLLASGTAIVVRAFSRGALTDETSGLLLPVIAISTVLVAQVFLMVPLGWVPVSTIAFAVVAFAFGSRALLRNLLFGAVLAGVTFVLFNYGLGFRLPLGSVVEALL
jgi:putative tricarboxylic transport membrane protein